MDASREAIMNGRGGVLPRMAAQVMLPLLGIAVLLRVLVAEGDTYQPSAYMRYPPSGGLLPTEEKYLEWAQTQIDSKRRTARVRGNRSLVVTGVSGLSALAITLAVAVGAPPWVAAVLGFIAAAGQFLERLSHDREQSHLCHQAAVRLQYALRDFVTDSGELTGPALRRRFGEFRQTFERVKEECDSELFKIRDKKPPQIEGRTG
jgi:hypothetical protein